MQERVKEEFVSKAAHEAIPSVQVLDKREVIMPGDLIHVGPSAEGKRDGFDARVAEVRQWADGSVTVLVWGGRGFQLNKEGKVANVGRLSFKEVSPERVTRVWGHSG